MFCKYCRGSIDDDSVFCKLCGENLSKAEPKVEPAPISNTPIVEEPIVSTDTSQLNEHKCIYCSRPLRPEQSDTDTCDFCYIKRNAEKFSDKVPVDVTSVPEPKRNGSLIWVIVIIVIFILAVTLFSCDGIDTPQPNSSTTTSSVESMTRLEEVDEMYKNEVLEQMISWTLENADAYGSPSTGTNSSEMIDDNTYAVSYNFTAKNSSGTKIKYQLVSACDLSNDDCTIILLKLDNDTVYIDEDFFKE